MDKKPLSEKQRAAIERRKARGDYSRAGKKGGNTTKKRMLAKDPHYYEKRGYEGAEALQRNLGSKEQARAYYGRIGSIKKGEGKGGTQS